MADKYLDLTLEEFLAAITNTEKEYTIIFHGDEDDEPAEVSGTVQQLRKHLIDKPSSLELKKIILDAIKGAKEYAFDSELGEIEIYNYLENISSGFEVEKVRLILRQIETYDFMVFQERINDESQQIYNENWWEIPLTKSKKGATMRDYEAMRARTHPFCSWSIDFALSTLKNIVYQNVNTPNHSLEEIFTDHKSFVECMSKLVDCEPALLNVSNEKYTFVGNPSTQKGCVAQYFKYLKQKGIINQSLNRDELANVLSSQIANFKINGSSIDNQSTTYVTTFRPQLEE